VVSYSKSPLLEAFSFSLFDNIVEYQSIGVIRGPSSIKVLSEKARGKLPEGRSPFEEDSWERSLCVAMGFVGQALGNKGSLFAAAWNTDDGGKMAFIPFRVQNISL
jgi:hypothetical protein